VHVLHRGDTVGLLINPDIFRLLLRSKSFEESRNYRRASPRDPEATQVQASGAISKWLGSRLYVIFTTTVFGGLCWPSGSCQKRGD
jgi:hypothetical protein